ncbi:MULTISPECIES: tRNA (adenosine(37)-N6)-threonylcarbamoyltransferase complex transferase subunit TsaD [Saccharibacillus]|uniref:tRNA (adenosine(37)-N6)-threonylcarbamoyltransferase complex transferase subunit TsaD n=1 Tax=Saccharibacillus TaxID=456492 RepID=UPI001239FC98|nr:tRNA (adenosine(37)-N6)-threonylcarbamoyltransferase complex transferase subunit TsaD [Saccharibacillus sp. WB 17]MWJ30770.1 tRNA (adenosine(37)-N6)-threonylcarbamoyltransferase complex transferase subunit TsaD [Saccharibacillus sp. WB 17]
MDNVAEQQTGRAGTYILAVETSCDETSVAIVRDGRDVLVNLVASQIETHKAFGGVVPEVASRQHVECITRLMEQAIAESGLEPDELSAIAVTEGPGLVGALLVGIMAAKALAFALDKPLIGTHHIAGHIYANRLTDEIQYPAIALVVSGGHTEIVRMESEGRFEVVGQTRDDAVGEAYDKVARSLGFPYPGGPHVDRAAQASDTAAALPRVWLEEGSYDFSLSGLKSAVLNLVNQSRMKGEEIDQGAIARGFQESVVEVLVAKAVRAAHQFGAKQLLLCGGVAANGGLRRELTARCAAEGIPLAIPPMPYCTDNAAMIGAAAYVKWTRGELSDLFIKGEPGMSLEQWSVAE